MSSEFRNLPQRQEITFEPLSLLVLSGVFLFVVVVVFMMGFYFGKSHESSQIREVGANSQNFGDQSSMASLLPPVDTTFGEILAKNSSRELEAATAEPTPTVAPPPVEKYEDLVKPAAKNSIQEAIQETKVEVARAEQDFYAIQLGAFPKKEQASAQIDQLHRDGIKDAYFGPAHFGSNGKFYRVWLGRFDRYDAAKKTADRLGKTRKAKYFVVHIDDTRGGNSVGYSEKPSQTR